MTSKNSAANSTNFVAREADLKFRQAKISEQLAQLRTAIDAQLIEADEGAEGRLSDMRRQEIGLKGDLSDVTRMLGAIRPRAQAQRDQAMKAAAGDAWAQTREYCGQQTALGAEICADLAIAAAKIRKLNALGGCAFIPVGGYLSPDIRIAAQPGPLCVALLEQIDTALSDVGLLAAIQSQHSALLGHAPQDFEQPEAA